MRMTSWYLRLPWTHTPPLLNTMRTQAGPIPPSDPSSPSAEAPHLSPKFRLFASEEDLRQPTPSVTRTSPSAGEEHVAVHMRRKSLQVEIEESWLMAQQDWLKWKEGDYTEESDKYPSGCAPPLTWWRQALICCWSLLVAACVVGMAILIGFLAHQRGETSDLRFGADVSLVSAAMAFAGAMVTSCLAAMWHLATRLEKQTHFLLKELERARALPDNAAESKTAFLASISHEIRTPINGVIGMLGSIRESSSLSAEDCDSVETALFSCWTLIDWLTHFVYTERGMHSTLPAPLRPDTPTSIPTSTGPPSSPPPSPIEPLLGAFSLAEQQPQAPPWSLTKEGGGLSGGWTSPRCSELSVELSDATTPELPPGPCGEAVSELLPSPDARWKDERWLPDATHWPLSLPKSPSPIPHPFSRMSLPCVPVRPIPLLQVLPRRLSSLPATPSSSSSPHATKRAPIPGLEGRMVLVVDDNSINRRVLAGSLARYGLLVVQAEDGRKALEAMQPMRAHCFLCVFMDLQMPVMDGYEATREIRRQESDSGAESESGRSEAAALMPRRRVPIFAITADVVSGVTERCEEAGMDEFLTKPLAAATLHEVLMKLDVGEVPLQV